MKNEKPRAELILKDYQVEALKQFGVNTDNAIVVYDLSVGCGKSGFFKDKISEVIKNDNSTKL